MNQIETKTKHSHFEHAVISWIAPEYVQHHKDAKWYATAAIIAAIAVVVSVLTGNWTMAIAVVTLAWVYQYIQRNHPPKDIAIAISELGVHVGEMFFPYSHIKAFWIIYKNSVKTLNLRVNGRVYSDVEIQLDGQDPVPVRKFLVTEIPEWEGKEEPFTDIILRLLKF